GPDPQAPVTGNLTMQQLQEIAILQQDAQALEEAALADAHAAMPPPEQNIVAVVDLSPLAQAIAAGGAVPAAAQNPVFAPPVASFPLTTAQLAQIAPILQPLANQPLNAALLAQIEAELEAVLQNPVTLS